MQFGVWCGALIFALLMLLLFIVAIRARARQAQAESKLKAAESTLRSATASLEAYSRTIESKRLAIEVRDKAIAQLARRVLERSGTLDGVSGDPVIAGALNTYESVYMVETRRGALYRPRESEPVDQPAPPTSAPRPTRRLILEQ